MMAKKRGRKYNPKSISHTGTSHTFLLNEVDERSVQRLMEWYGQGFSELMRTLIREAAHEMEMEPNYIAKQMSPNPPQMDEPDDGLSNTK